MKQGSAPLQPFVDTLKQKLRSFENDIDRLAHNGTDSPLAAEKRERLVVDLRRQREHVQSLIADLEKASTATFAKMRPSVERTVTHLAEALDDAKRRLLHH